ncbi:hypothetical protein N0V90_006578 [Kalmusia sp. IMI 367209]|nr:hypothetical protein N0V90_006578 [Kalmusia sp. IMI 367209]
MSSGFVSGGTIEEPTERDDEWRAAQAELEQKRREKEDRDKQHDGKSLYEVLQANKAAKQEAFEEASRLKNQYRALDDDEAEFLDSVLDASRKKEADVRKETLEQLDGFRRRQEEAERNALEDETPEGGKGEEAHWVSHPRKRKKGPELLKGVKLKKGSSAADDKDKGEKKEEAAHANSIGSTVAPASKSDPTKPSSASPPSKLANPVSLGLGYASSDDDD